jgi:hypothetical protein
MENLHPGLWFYKWAFVILACISWPFYLFMTVAVPIKFAFEGGYANEDLSVIIGALIFWAAAWSPFIIAPFILPILAFVVGRASTKVEQAAVDLVLK